MGKTEVNFLDYYINKTKKLGVWYDEDYKQVLLATYMSVFKEEIIREYEAVDFVVKDDKKVLIKWIRRFEPLSDYDLEKIIGKK